MKIILSRSLKRPRSINPPCVKLSSLSPMMNTASPPVLLAMKEYMPACCCASTLASARLNSTPSMVRNSSVLMASKLTSTRSHLREPSILHLWTVMRSMRHEDQYTDWVGAYLIRFFGVCTRIGGVGCNGRFRHPRLASAAHQEKEGGRDKLRAAWSHIKD